MRRRSSSESQSDYEREKDRRRRLWMIQKEKEREHEKLKQKKIEEYERKRAELLKLSKLNLSEENTSPSCSSITSNVGEVNLKNIIVKIQRKIPASTTVQEANDLKATTDEEKLIKSQAQQIEEYRTVQVITNKGNQAKEVHLERRSISLNVRTQRSLSPKSHESHLQSHRSRRDEYSKRYVDSHYDRDHSSSRHASRSRDTSRGNLKKRRTSRGRSPSREGKSSHRRSHSRERRTSRGRSHSRERKTSPGRSHSRSRRQSRGHSHSRERDYRRSERDHSRSSRCRKSQEKRGRSRDRSRDLRDERDIPRDWFQLPYPYVGPMPYPAYYGSFPPGPMMFEPPMMPPARGPRGGPLPMPPMRPPYPPRFIPPHAYRGPVPHNPHYHY